jgi:hypothetical protein
MEILMRRVTENRMRQFGGHVQAARRIRNCVKLAILLMYGTMAKGKFGPNAGSASGQLTTADNQLHADIDGRPFRH